MGNVCDRWPSLTELNHTGNLRWKNGYPPVFWPCQRSGGCWLRKKLNHCTATHLQSTVLTYMGFWIRGNGAIPQEWQFFPIFLCVQSAQQWATSCENMVVFLSVLADHNRKQAWLNPGAWFYITKIWILFGFCRQKKADFFGYSFNLIWWVMYWKVSICASPFSHSHWSFWVVK